MRRWQSFGLILAVVLVGFSSVQAAVFKADQTPTFTEPVTTDLFTAGTTISLTAPVSGEVFAAGSDVTATKHLDRSVFAAGSTVTIKDGAGYNVFAAGSTVTLGGKIGHDVYIAGNTIVFEDGTEVMGDVRAAGKSVVLKGKIHGNVILGAESATSSADIDGNLTAEGDKLRFTGGTVGGDLSYTTPKTAEGLTSVTVKGTTTRHEPSTTDQSSGFGHHPTKPSADSLLFGLLMFLVVGAIFLLVLPARIANVYQDLRTSWGKQFLLGLAVLALAGPLALVFALSFVAWPIALLVGMLALVLVMIADGIVSVLAGRLLMDWAKMKGSWWEALVIGSLVLVILGAVPLVNTILAFLIVFGIILPAVGSLAHGLWFNLRAKS